MYTVRQRELFVSERAGQKQKKRGHPIDFEGGCAKPAAPHFRFGVSAWGSLAGSETRSAPRDIGKARLGVTSNRGGSLGSPFRKGEDGEREKGLDSVEIAEVSLDCGAELLERRGTPHAQPSGYIFPLNWRIAKRAREVGHRVEPRNRHTGTDLV